MQQVNDYTLSKQRAVFERKFEEGLKQMRVDSKLEETYPTTEAFVQEMQKYFKIAQVCTTNLQDCFAAKISTSGYTISYPNGNKTEKATSKNSEEITLSSTMTTKSLIPKSAYDSNVIGIRFTDGTNLLITYKPNCAGAEAINTTEDTAKCFGYIADVNFQKSPNIIGKDIVTNMNLNGDFQILSKGSSQPLNASECEELKKTHPEINACDAMNDKDYWAGAILKCDKEGGRLPSSSDIEKLFSQLFDNEGNIKNETLWSYINRNDDGIIDAWQDSASGASGKHFYINYNTKAHSFNTNCFKHLGNNIAYCIK